MNRRRFLSFLGLAPVAAAVPAMALPRPEKPTEIDKLEVTITVGPNHDAEVNRLVREKIKEIVRLGPYRVRATKDLHERIEGGLIIRDAGDLRYSVTL
ncbi:twin-arginine translocation signal domain-containing protein [Brucella intermedia]|uniref:twin-arginine translocation signal domain-containing protein n=1 Tax=Brucella intermedia TaxID=94625 RepID=UPI00209AC3FA|nr:twin-arginine translocation signal domain-containing protein [Brucella intermedia]MCO7737517.1 twin-arginine translocation signal domain-containing protein [Brucella intermedia]